MHILNKPMAILGALIASLSTVFCPFIKVPIVGKWNMFDTDTGLFLVTIGLIALCVLLFFLRSVKWYRISSFIFFGWCILAIVAVYFKINNFFGFKFADNLLSKTLHLQWGWAVLLLGAIMMVISVRKVKSIN